MNAQDLTPHSRTSWWTRPWFVSAACLSALAAVAITLGVRHIARNAEPDLRARIIETASKRFDAPVDLDRVEISAMNGLQVTGYGLRVYNPRAKINAPTGLNQAPAGLNQTPATPGTMIYVREFRFRTDLRNLRHSEARLGLVNVDGLELHIPPSDERGPLLPKDASPADPNRPRIQPKSSLAVTHVVVDNAELVIETDKLGKEPLHFDIAHVDLADIGNGRPFHYDAILTNPKPTGNIHAVGRFGPWQTAEPRSSPIEGNYTFDHADLNSIKGLGGILSSTGHFAGKLSSIAVDGVTDTPAFSLDVSEHPVPLHTEFHAIVDGTTGDTYLDPVRARMLHSFLTARGKVVKVNHLGHDIDLTIDMEKARMEDMLRLAVKTSPPVMRGALAMHTRLHIPPGNQRVAQKIQLAGSFGITEVAFSNPATQDKIDALSLRAQGRPREARLASTDHEAEVRSSMKAHFTLSNALTTVTDLHYDVPGASVILNGIYSLDGQQFEFKGHVRTTATASHMTTGWKSVLLKPVDPFFKKDGAGLVLPIQVSGTRNAPHFGLALHGSAADTPAQMEQELRLHAQEDAAIRAQARKAPKVEQ